MFMWFQGYFSPDTYSWFWWISYFCGYNTKNQCTNGTVTCLYMCYSKTLKENSIKHSDLLLVCLSRSCTLWSFNDILSSPVPLLAVSGSFILRQPSLRIGWNARVTILGQFCFTLLLFLFLFNDCFNTRGTAIISP